MRVILIAVAASLFFAGAAAAQTGAVQITKVWARATPAKAENGAAYLTMQAASPDRLTGVSSPVAGKAELHEMTMTGDVMKMRQVAGIDLPAGKSVTLKPGGYHIMLIGLKQPLHVGDKVPLTLTFAKAGPQQVEATVEGVGAMGPAGASGAGKSMPMNMPMPSHQ